MKDEKYVLPESGLDEFEIIEFSVDKVFYGINVTKVREIINLLPITVLPKTHPHIDGVFTLRGKIIPLVNLTKSFNSNIDSIHPQIIVAEMNDTFIGFKVDAVSRIYSVSKKQVEATPEASRAEQVIGVVKMENRLIILLDFAKILSQIAQ